LPSSLAVNHSSALGCSPRPPVSVCGTGARAWSAGAFLGSMVTCTVRSAGASRYCRVSGLPYALQPPIPSGGGSFTPASPPCSARRYGNVSPFSIGIGLRLSLRPRLTLIRLALIRKPWSCGVRVSHPDCRYSCLHLLFPPLQQRSRAAFHAGGNAPLPVHIAVQSTASAPRLTPDHHPCPVARLVSCYALFE
jgi:hypothetical protein